MTMQEVLDQLRSTPLRLRELTAGIVAKGTDLSVHSPADLRRVETELNDRPRKSLNGRSPSEVFNEMRAHLDPDRCDDR